MVDENEGHEACVVAWLERAAEGLPAARLLDLLERAFEALWGVIRPTLSDVTIGAIAGRVLYDASERFPPFASLEVGPAGLRFDGVRARVDDLHADELALAVRTMLVEFLTVLGHLTAEVLTPTLHVTLAAVALDPPAGAPVGGPKAGPKRSKKRRKS